MRKVPPPPLRVKYPTPHLPLTEANQIWSKRVPWDPFSCPNLATLAAAGLPLLACGALFYLCYTLPLIHTHSRTLSNSHTLTHALTHSLTLTPLSQPLLALTPPFTSPPLTPRPCEHSLPIYSSPLLPIPSAPSHWRPSRFRAISSCASLSRHCTIFHYIVRYRAISYDTQMCIFATISYDI